MKIEQNMKKDNFTFLEVKKQMSQLEFAAFFCQ